MSGTPLPPLGKWCSVLIALPCFVVGLFGWLRFASALRDWDYLTGLALRPGPMYLAIGGVLWGVLGWGAVVLAGLRLRGAWNRPAIFILALLVGLSYWVDLLGFTRPAEMLVNWPYALTLTGAGLVYFFFLLRLPRWWQWRKEAVNVR